MWHDVTWCHWHQNSPVFDGTSGERISDNISREVSHGGSNQAGLVMTPVYVHIALPWNCWMAHILMFRYKRPSFRQHEQDQPWRITPGWALLPFFYKLDIHLQDWWPRSPGCASPCQPAGSPGGGDGQHGQDQPWRSTPGWAPFLILIGRRPSLLSRYWSRTNFRSFWLVRHLSSLDFYWPSTIWVKRCCGKDSMSSDKVLQNSTQLLDWWKR